MKKFFVLFISFIFIFNLTAGNLFALEAERELNSFDRVSLMVYCFFSSCEKPQEVIKEEVIEKEKVNEVVEKVVEKVIDNTKIIKEQIVIEKKPIVKNYYPVEVINTTVNKTIDTEEILELREEIDYLVKKTKNNRSLINETLKYVGETDLNDYEISELGDVDSASATFGQILSWDGGEWVAADNNLAIGGNSNDTLRWDGTGWISNDNFTIDENGNTITVGSATFNSFVEFNGDLIDKNGDSGSGDQVLVSDSLGGVVWEDKYIASISEGLSVSNQVIGISYDDISIGIDDSKLSIKDEGISTDKYENFSITNEKIANNSVLIDKFADVDTSTVAPLNNQVLSWNGNNWAPSSVIAEGLYGSNGVLNENRTVDLDLNNLVFTGGNVGIGTSNPTEQLELANNLELQETTSSDIGIIKKNGINFIHNFNPENNGTVDPIGGNLFFGLNSGNFTMGATAASVNEASDNIGLGGNVLSSNTIGSKNIAIGNYSLISNTSGNENIGVGDSVLRENTNGENNIGVGGNSLISNTSGNENVGVGKDSLKFSQTGIGNIAVGLGSGEGTANYINSDFNTLLGYEAGGNIGSNSDRNIYIGYQTGKNQVAGTSDNILIGNSLITDNNNGSQKLNIGNAIYGDLITNNIGIGVENPNYSLDVAGTGHFTDLLTLDGDLADKDGDTGFAGQILANSVDGVNWVNEFISSTGNAVSATSGILNVLFDNSTIAKDGSNRLYIPTGGITSTQIFDNSITNADIASEAITSSELADNSVSNSKIADNSIGSRNYIDNSIDESYINWGTGISEINAGDIPVQDANNNYDDENIEGALEQLGSNANKRWSTGLIEGGELSDNGDNDINILSGSGFINDASNKLKEITWNNLNDVNLSFDGDNFIYIDVYGNPYITNTESNQDNYIYLGYANTISSNLDIRMISSNPSSAGNYTKKNNEWIENTLGIMVESGNVVTENVTNLQLSVNSGSIYSKLNNYTTSDTVSIIKWYKTTDNDWVQDINNLNYVSTSQYNDKAQNQSSALISLSSNYWKKDLILRTLNGNVHYVYGQNQYATEVEAKESAFPVIPDSIQKAGSVFLATIVSQQGDVTIANRLYDVRPNMDRVFGFGTSGTTGTAADHGDLTGLLDDDHVQYLRVDGTRSLTGNLNLGGNSIIGIDSLTMSGLFVNNSITTPQFKVGHDDSNYYTTSVASDGHVTFDSFGSNQGFTFSDPLTLTTDLTVQGNVLSDTIIQLGDSNTDEITINAIVQGVNPLVFEGLTNNSFETTLAIENPTQDRILTLPNLSGILTTQKTNLTNGSILFADSDNQISENNSDFFWDDVNKRLGVGTNTPTHALQVIGQVSASSFASADGTVGLPSYRFNSDLDTGMFRSGDNKLSFTTAGNESLTLDSLGNIGIGDTTPDAKLDVAGSFRLDGSFIDKDGDSGISGQILSSSNTGTNWINRFITSVGGALTVVNGNLEIAYDNITIGLNGSNQFEIKDNSIVSGKIADLNITTDKINNLAVTNGKIANNSIFIDKLADVDTSTTLPLNNQVLSWNSLNSNWLPSNVSDIETTTTLTDNGNGTFSYVNEEATTTVMNLAGSEPWLGVDDGMGATSNVEDIYMMGKVMIGRNALHPTINSLFSIENINTVDDNYAVQINSHSDGMLIQQPAALTGILDFDYVHPTLQLRRESNSKGANLLIGNQDGGGYIYGSDGVGLAFYDTLDVVNEIARMKGGNLIVSNGEVNHKLVVSRYVTEEESLTIQTNNIDSIFQTNQNEASGVVSNIKFQLGNILGQTPVFIIADSTSGTAEEKFRVDVVTGNVGIGVNNPTEKLVVGGNIKVVTGNDICIEGGNCLGTLEINNLLNASTESTSLFLGENAGFFDDSTDNSNTFVGYGAGFSNDSGEFNTVLGATALALNLTGSNNIAIGSASLSYNTNGGSNIAIGSAAGAFSRLGALNETSSSSIYLGTSTTSFEDGSMNEIVLGNNAEGSGSNSVTLGNNDIAKTVLKGLVGIGTDSPAAALHLKKDALALYPQLIIEDNDSATFSQLGGFWGNNNQMNFEIINENWIEGEGGSLNMFREHAGQLIVGYVNDAGFRGNYDYGLIVSKKASFHSDIRVDGAFEDADGDAGIADQFLVSTGIGTDWKSFDPKKADFGCVNNEIIKWNDVLTEWECSTDAGIASSYDVYDNLGGQEIPVLSAITVNLDTVRQANSNYSLAVDQVTVNSDGLYEVTYSGSSKSSNSNRTEVKWSLDVNTIVQDGSACTTYNREIATGENTCTRTLILNLNNGDDLRIRAISGQLNEEPDTMVDGTSLTIKKFVESGADYAEVYYTNNSDLEAGDVVGLDSELAVGVDKANLNNSPIGVISTNPGKIIGAGDDWVSGRPVAVALNGRVPVKVSLEAGDISIGDKLSLSEISGVIKKYEIGDENILGLALENYTNENEPDNGFGIILTFIQIQNVDNNLISSENIVEKIADINIGELTDILESENEENWLINSVKSLTSFVIEFVETVENYFDRTEKLEGENIDLKNKNEELEGRLRLIEETLGINQSEPTTSSEFDIEEFVELENVPEETIPTIEYEESETLADSENSEEESVPEEIIEEPQEELVPEEETISLESEIEIVPESQETLEEPISSEESSEPAAIIEEEITLAENEIPETGEQSSGTIENEEPAEPSPEPVSESEPTTPSESSSEESSESAGIIVE